METNETRKDMSERGGSLEGPSGEPGPSGVSSAPENADRRAWTLAVLLLAAVLILHGLAYYLAPGWLWGAHTLYSLTGVVAVALLVLGGLSLWPRLVLAVVRPIEKLWDRTPRWALRDVVVAAVLTGALAGFLFWGLGVRDPVAGVWFFHSPYLATLPGATPTALAMPALIYALGSGLDRALDVTYAQAVRGIAIGLGAILCPLILLVPLRREAAAKTSMGFLLALSGAVLIFLSLRADLAFEALATAAFLVLALASVEGGVSPFFPGVVACCAAVVHPLGLALLPAWAFLMWQRAAGAKARSFTLALIGSAFVVALALLALDVTVGDAFRQMVTVLKSTWGTGSGSHAGWVLSLVAGRAGVGSVLGAAGWLVERIWGTFNGLLFVAPAGLALAIAALAARPWRRASPGLAFLGLAAILTGVVAFAAAPFYGPPRAWGLYAPFGICVTAFAGWCLAGQHGWGARFKALVMGAIAISLIHVLPPLFASRNVLVGAERLSMLASSSSPWDIRGRASSLEQTAGFYLNTGDTLSAAGQLAKAWKVRPNPLYLGAAGTYYAGIRRYDLAETQFKTLVDARPSDKEANLSLGIVYALSGDFEKAKPHFLIAYGDTSLVLPEPEIDTTDWVDWPHGPERERVRTQRWKARTESQKTFLEGEKAARSGDLAQAEQLYRKALEIYPRWGRMQYEAHCHIGTVCSMRGQVREAAYEYLLALNSYGRYPLCYFIANGVAYGPVRRSIPGATGPGTDMHIQ